MSWALLGLLAIALTGNVTQAIWLHGASSDRDAASDAAAEWRLRFAETSRDLTEQQNNVKTLTSKLSDTETLLKAVEQERNQLQARGHDDFVQRLQAASPQEAARLVADLVTTAIAGGVLSQRPRSEDPIDGLVDPSKD